MIGSVMMRLEQVPTGDIIRKAPGASSPKCDIYGAALPRLPPMTRDVQHSRAQTLSDMTEQKVPIAISLRMANAFT